MPSDEDEESDKFVGPLPPPTERQRIRPVRLPVPHVQPRAQAIDLSMDDSPNEVMDVASLPIIDLVFDDNDQVELNDQFQIELTGKEIDHRYRTHGSCQFRLKGVVFSNLFVLQDNDIGLFLGVDDCVSVPPDVSFKLRFRYDLISSLDEVLSLGQEVDWLCTRYEGIPGTRVDSGNWHNFKSYTSAAELRRTAQHGGKMVLHVRLRIQEMFKPAERPILLRGERYKSKAATGMVGVENQGATCYLNSLLQMLFHINVFRKLVYELPLSDEEVNNSTTLALQSVFRNLQYSNQEVSTHDLTTAFGWTSAEAFMQQDIQEMLRVLLDKLEEKMKQTALDGSIQRLFAGKVRSYIQCAHVDFASNREEDFYDVQLDVKGCRDIYESMRKYVEIEMLDGENQYDAGPEFGKQDAKKGVVFTQFPPVLTMHLKRFDFDFQSMGFKKIHDHYQFPTCLDLDEFLAADCPAEARASPNRYILHSVLVHAGDVGGGHYYAYIRPSTENNCQTVYTVADIDAHSSNNNSNNNSSSSSNNSSCKGGGDWFKFNDDVVLQVTEREAVKSCYGRRSQANCFFAQSFNFSSAYMLVYIREAEAPQIMAPVLDTDIPQVLAKRLDAEMRRKRAIARKAQRDKMFERISYVLIEDIASFQRYSRSSDLVDDLSFRTLEVYRDSTLVGIHLRLAAALNISPYMLRLWYIEGVSFNTSRNEFLRVTHAVSADEFGKIFNSKKGSLFAFVAKPTIPRPSFAQQATGWMFQHNQPISMQEAEIEDESMFLETIQYSEEKFRRLRDAFITEAQKYPEIVEMYKLDDPDAESLEDMDALRACGPGLGNKVFHDLGGFDPDFTKALLETQRNIVGELITHYQGFYTDESSPLEDDIPEFALQQQADGTLHVSDEATAKAAAATGVVNNKRKDAKDESDEMTLLFFRIFDPFNMLPTAPVPVPAAAIPQPVRHIPYELSGDSMGLDQVNFTVQRRVDYHAMKFLGHAMVRQSESSEAVSNIANVLLQQQFGALADGVLESAQFYLSLSPTNCVAVPIPSYSQNENGDIEDDEPGSIASLGESEVERYMDDYGTYVFILSIMPNSDTASQIVYRPTALEAMHCDAPDKWMRFQVQKRSALVLPYSAREMLILHQLALHRRQLQEKQLQQSDHDVVDHMNDDNADVDSSKKRKRNGQSNHHQNIDVSNEVLQVVHGLEVDCAGNLKVPDFIGYLSSVLQVPSEHLTICIVPETLDDPLDQATVLPFSNCMVQSTILESLGQERKVAVRCRQWYVFFRILPQALLTADGNDFCNDHRILDVLICDRRLRFWRRVYFTQLLLQKDPDALLQLSAYLSSPTQQTATNKYKQRKLNVDSSASTFRSLHDDNNVSKSTDDADDNDDDDAGFLGLWTQLWQSGRMSVYGSPSKHSRPSSVAGMSSTGTAYPHVGGGSVVEGEEATLLQELRHVFTQLTWPSLSQSNVNSICNNNSMFDLLQVPQLHVALPVEAGGAALVQTLRSCLGLPLNPEQLTSLATQYMVDNTSSLSASSNNAYDDETQLGDIMIDQQHVHEDDSMSALLSRLLAEQTEQRHHVLVSESLHVQHDGDNNQQHEHELERVSVQYMEADADNNNSNNNNSGVLRPLLPLALCAVRDGIIQEVLMPGDYLHSLGLSWCESLSPPLHTLSRMCVQLMPPEDQLFMHNLHPIIRSMAVSVVNFTLRGTLVSPCSPEHFCGPCLTYVREDDDYETFIVRLSRVLDESERDLLRLRMAVVDPMHFTAEFIAKPPVSSGGYGRLPDVSSMTSLPQLLNSPAHAPTPANKNIRSANNESLTLSLHATATVSTTATVAVPEMLMGDGDMMLADDNSADNNDNNDNDDDEQCSTSAEVSSSPMHSPAVPPTTSAAVETADASSAHKVRIVPTVTTIHHTPSAAAFATAAERPASRSGSVTPSIYDRLKQFYPEFGSAQTFSQARERMYMSSSGGRSLRSTYLPKVHIPLLGLQRSAVDSLHLNSKHHPLFAQQHDKKPQYATGIKIV